MLSMWSGSSSHMAMTVAYLLKLRDVAALRVVAGGSDVGQDGPT